VNLPAVRPLDPWRIECDEGVCTTRGRLRRSRCPVFAPRQDGIERPSLLRSYGGQPSRAIKSEGWWTLPESATKNRVTHRVPLTDRVVELLTEAKADAPKESPWVSAGIKGGSVAARAVKAGADLKRAEKESGERLLSFAFSRR